MTELLNEMETALTDLLQTGFATWDGGGRFEKLAEECESRGLHTGAAMMGHIGQLLNLRAHSLEKHDDSLAVEVCRTVRYIALCREKDQEDAILARWQAEGGE